MRIAGRLLGALSMVALFGCGSVTPETKPLAAAEPTSISCPPDDGISSETSFLDHGPETTAVSPEAALDEWLPTHPKLQRENFTRDDSSGSADGQQRVRFLYKEGDIVRGIVRAVPAGIDYAFWAVSGSQLCGSLL